MRLFIAIDTPKEIKEYFKQLQTKIGDNLAKIKLTTDFHQTLKFLGEVPEDKLEQIKELLSKIKFKPFTAQLSELGVFPSEHYIRVIWIGFTNNKPIIALQQQIEQSLLDIFPKDKRFHPHITLARVKFVKEKEKLIRKLKDIKIEPKEFAVTQFKLIKSTLTKQGPIYEDLTVFPSE